MGTRGRNALIGLLALMLAGGLVVLTGAFLTGSVRAATTPVYAEFNNCGQGLHEGGDVKLRGVLVGRIGALLHTPESPCRIRLDLQPDILAQIPRNAGAQIRAKTVFGEKWVELLFPPDPLDERIREDDTIHKGRTIDPLEVEEILTTALPLLEAIDPEALAGALEALASGFVGQEDDIIAAVEDGLKALRPLNRDEPLVNEGLTQLNESARILSEVDDDLFAALQQLDRVNVFTTANTDLITENLRKTPKLLGELSTLFQVRLIDLVKLANEGATVISLVAARADDVDALLSALPAFSSAWIRNLNADCPVRQATTEPGLSKGDPIPGRCWRVHNIVSESQGAYAPGEEPMPGVVGLADYAASGFEVTSALGRILYAPVLDGRRAR